ncbi:MAG: hypothetical protein DRP87_17840 [Spirochaetes bacterium]|nr:MAG: hypothetical protein DRP87_17840 [Spirochaetota bacterium]
MGMATPLAMIRGGDDAAGRGILMRSGEAFQVIKDIKKIIFDKTGTLTEGRPHVVDLVPLNGWEEIELLRLAGAEMHSEHPLWKAVIEYARKAQLNIPEVSDFHAIPGRGIRASLEDRVIRIGSLLFLDEIVHSVCAMIATVLRVTPGQSACQTIDESDVEH